MRLSQDKQQSPARKAAEPGPERCRRKFLRAVKPNVTRIAARKYGYPVEYASRPSWATYKSILDFAATVRGDLRDLAPRDMIDLQSFLWVQGSDEYT